FYAVVIGVAAGLAALPFSFRYVPIQFGVPCLVAACLLLWSLVPRVDRWQPRGIALDPQQQPKLFRELDAVALATEQRVPSEVYVTLDANASVAVHGGWMGFGGRRVLCLGLPLIATLDAAEMRATLAHEFGHFAAGDLGLGRWLHLARATVART